MSILRVQKLLSLVQRNIHINNAGLVFLEILNFHSHTGRSVNIYLKEQTTNYMSQARNYVVNTTLVKIESYTEGLINPAHATIY